MSPLVLDCSVALAWLFEDEACDHSESALQAVAGGAVAWVPSIWPLEVSNVLLVGERRGRITAAQSAAFWQVLDGFDIRVDPQTAQQASQATLHLARQHGLSSYDAAYLELAMRMGAHLLTLDKKLQVAMADCGVATLEQ